MNIRQRRTKVREDLCSSLSVIRQPICNGIQVHMFHHFFAACTHLIRNFMFSEGALPEVVNVIPTPTKHEKANPIEISSATITTMLYRTPRLLQVNLLDQAVRHTHHTTNLFCYFFNAAFHILRGSRFLQLDNVTNCLYRK